MINTPRHLRSARQRGAALVVSLLLLLVLTILGVTALNSSVMQNFMATSFQTQTTILAEAENVLLGGELDVEEIVFTGIDDRDFFFMVCDVDDPTLDFPVTQFDAVWPNPFVIEYLGEWLIPGESVAIGSGFEDSLVHFFRVSARQERPEGQRGGLRIVQSLYVTLAPPDQECPP